MYSKEVPRYACVQAWLLGRQKEPKNEVERQRLRCQGGVCGQRAEVRKDGRFHPSWGRGAAGVGRPPGLRVDGWQVQQAPVGSETFLPGNHL